MKQLRLIIVLALLALSSNLKAQPYLVLSGDPICNDVEVVAYVYDPFCNLLDKTLEFVIPAGGMPSTSYDLSQPLYWANGVPTGTWTIEDVSVKDRCGLSYKVGGTCPSGRQNAVFLHTGINCTTLISPDCFEYADPCAPCGIGDIVNATISVVGSNTIVHIY